LHTKAHFAAPQWVDLVRGQLPEEVANEMDTHLRAGCEECAAAFDAWQGLAVFASDERALTPPEDAVRVAKSYLAQHKLAEPVRIPPTSVVSWASATLATLVFDSRQAAPAGIRAAATAAFSRHLVFDAKTLVIDLHIDTASRKGWFLLAGQVADTSRPDQPLENVWLSLVDDRQEISMFQTNELGEFRCTFNLRRALKLMVYAGRDVVAIPIEAVFDPSTDTGTTH
jgi:hypothetical protein